MSRRMSLLGLAVAGVLLWTAAADAGVKSGLKKGTPKIQEAGPIAFGPDGILFLGDPQSAAIFAIDTGDTSGNPSKVKLNVKGLDKKIASLLGTSAKQVRINDLAINPASGNAYLSVSRGRGPDAEPVLLRVDGSGKLSPVSTENVPFARAELPNPPPKGKTGRRGRRQSITDLAYVDGRLFVAGLSNEEFASKLRSIPFPFQKVDDGTSVEIFHGSHGRFETRSPVRTFVPYNIAGDPHVLAAYTCTPLVKFPVAKLKPGAKIKGTTVAELGNRNRPLDMIVYSKDGQDYLLMANSSRGVMKITTDGLKRDEGITQRIKDKAGQDYETIAGLEGVIQLDGLNDKSAVILARRDSGAVDLQTVALP